jgi:hypothetical protein
MTQPLMRVDRFTLDVAAEIRSVAQAFPYRSNIGVDADRVFWVVEAGGERTGVAYAPDAADGPCWMIAFSHELGKRSTRSRIRDIVRMIAGPQATWETAPLFEGAPSMTMVRVPITP